jgi:hypothetical protein
MGVAMGLLDFHLSTLRSVPFYSFFIVIQLAFCAFHLFRLNILTAIFGAANTFLFLVAIVFEVFSKDFPFNPVLTSSVFTQYNRTIAINSILVGLSIFYIIVACRLTLGKPEWKSLNAVEKTTLRRMILLLIFLGGFLMFITTPIGSVLETRYAVGQKEGLINSGGLDMLGVIFLQGVLLIVFLLDRIKSRFSKLMFWSAVLMVIQFRLLKGDREILVALFIMYFFLYMITTKHALWKRIGTIAASFVITYLGILFWGNLRANLSTEGTAVALKDAQADIFTTKQDEASRGVVFLNRIDLLPQSYWHLLHSVDLYETGTRLNGQSFKDLPLQMLPKPLTDLVGYERPLNDAWLLAKYRLHMGGIYMLATGYWNYGLWGVAFIAAFTAFFCTWMESWYRRQKPFLWFFYLGFLGGIVNAIFYGWQPLFKSIEIAVLFAFLFKYAFIFYKQHLSRQKFMLSIPA